MIYLDYGATAFRKPQTVVRAVAQAMAHCASPGRGGYSAAMQAERTVFHAREEAARLFHCRPEQAVFTASCTHGLNIAIRTLVKPGARVVISGFEHNAVTRPLHALDARITVAGRRLFSWEDTLEEFERALRQGAEAAVFTHVSNVFGYILPVEEMAALCRGRGIPFVLDAAQSAGTLEVDLEKLGAAFIAMPGHKGLYGPQGTGLLLCGMQPEPLLYGGTGSISREQDMPRDLPDRLEPGTLNVPGIAGLAAGMAFVRQSGPGNLLRREHSLLEKCVRGLSNLGANVYAGEHQAATLSFLAGEDCEKTAEKFARRGVALRAGLHCAPLAHESAGTVDSGTVRLSLGAFSTEAEIRSFLQAAARILGKQRQ